LVHPIDPIDCIDLEESKFVWSKVDPNTMLTVNHLVLDNTKIPKNRLLFRAKKYAEKIIIERELAQEIVDSGFTGAKWIEIK
jgi:hypothetical protein